MPQNYNFIYFTNGSSASAANLYYFKISNTKTNPFWLGDFQKYKKDYDLLLNNKQDYIFLTFHPLSVKDMFLLDKKVDMYYIARDPIEKLQHGINHTENDLIDKEIQKNPLSKRFNLTCDYNKLFVSPIYRLGAKTPQIHVLHDKWIYTNYVAFSSYLKIWQNLGIINNVYCVDFKDFSKEKAFDTFSKVAKYFHFEPPKDEKIFNDRINRNRGVLINLPTTLYAHPNDISNMFDSTNNKQNLESLNLDSGVSIHIGTYQDFITNAEFIDISSEFFTEKLIIDKTQILIFMLKAEFDILSKNNDLLNACKKYIKGYINALQNRIKETQSHLISEDSIIEYLRDHKDLREKIRNIMDIELSYFKENHAEMMQGWEYYQKFEIMCKQEDSKSLQKSNQSTQSKISKNIIESKTITPPPPLVTNISESYELQDKTYWENYYKTHSKASKESLFASFCLHNFFKLKLVELGCGNGRDSIYFANNGLEVMGIDMCENEINLLAKNNPNVSFKCADFTRLDSINDVDIIYSRFTLHSITKEQQEHLFKWIVDNLKSNGLFCIEARGLKNSLYKKGEPVKNEKNAFIYNAHFRRFLDFEILCENLATHFKILYAKEDRNFAPYKDENDYFIRIIAKKL